MNDTLNKIKKKISWSFFKNSTLYFLLLSTSLSAQKRNLDSLLTVVNTQKDDTNKVKTLHEIGFSYYRIFRDKNKILEYASKELILAQRINYKKGIGTAYINYGIFYQEYFKFDLAIYYNKKALAIMSELHNKLGMSSCYVNLSLIYMRKGDYKEALSYFSKAIKLKEQIKDTKGIASAYNNISIVFINQGKYEDALRYSQIALKISDSLNDEEGVVRAYNNIGINFLSRKKFDEALDYFLKSISENRTSSVIDMGFAYNNIGNVYFETKQYDLALTYYLKTLKIREENAESNGLSLIYINLGNTYLALKQYKKALFYEHRAYKLAKEHEDKMGMQNANQSLGSCYEEMNQYDEAEKYYKMALKEAKESNYNEELKLNYESFAIFYRKTGQFEKALEYMTLFKELSDSLLNKENLKQINELNAHYETERKEREIELLIKDRELNEKIIKQQKQVRWALLFGLFLLSVSVVSIHLRYRFKQRANSILEAQKKEIEKNVIELTEAKDELNRVLEQKEKLASILAHDLRTPLRFMSTISEHMYRNRAALTSGEWEELSLELSNSAKSTFSFADELLTWLSLQKDNYELSYAEVNIEQLLTELCSFFSDISRMKGIVLQLTAEEHLVVETDSRLLKIILRNIIDNAIKNTNEGTISLSYFKVNETQFEIRVQDTGSGMTAEQIEKLMQTNLFGFPFEIRDKLGFQIVKDFSNLIGGSVRLESEIGKGTTVILLMPVNK